MTGHTNKKKKALFLDRDGVINVDKGYVHKIADCEFVEGIFEICRLARENGFMLVVVTNQAGIGRGYYTKDDFFVLMDYIRLEFAKRGCPLDDIFYCPFHPDGMGEYRRDSPDRKPAPGMILKAAEKHGIDLSQSILLGDKESDILAGINAGVKWNVRMDGSEVPDKIFSLLKGHGCCDRMD